MKRELLLPTSNTLVALPGEDFYGSTRTVTFAGGIQFAETYLNIFDEPVRNFTEHGAQIPTPQAPSRYPVTDFVKDSIASAVLHHYEETGQVPDLG